METNTDTSTIDLDAIVPTLLATGFQKVLVSASVLVYLSDSVNNPMKGHL